MKLRKKGMILVLIGMFSIGLLAQATQGKGRMRGTVVDKQTGQPIEGVTVKLFSVKAAGQHSDSPVTDKDGVWRAIFLRSGLWNVDFTKVGYQTVKISVNLSSQASSKMPEIQTEMIKVEGPQLDAGVAKEIERGQKFVSDNRIDEALQVFEAVLTQFKDSQGVAIVNMYIGNCHSVKENYLKAIDAYKLALVQYPDNQELIISVGNSYTNLNQPDEAMNWFSKVPFDELTNIDTIYNIGTNFYNSQKYDQAIKYYSKATEISPDFAPAWYQLGMAFVAQDKKKETIVALKKFMELDPESPDFETAKEIVKAFEVL